MKIFKARDLLQCSNVLDDLNYVNFIILEDVLHRNLENNPDKKLFHVFFKDGIKLAKFWLDISNNLNCSIYITVDFFDIEVIGRVKLIHRPK